MNLESLTFLFRYNRSANDQILAAAAKLSPAQFTEPVAFLGADPPRSLRSVLVHTLGGEWLWRTRCMQGISPPTMLSEDEFATLEDLRVRWMEESEILRYYIAGLTSARLLDPVSYTATSGQSYHTPLWEILSHLVLHGMQHRAEAALALTNFGASPGDIDLIRFARQQRD